MMVIPHSWWVIFFTAMTPIGELRAAIPLGVGWYKLSPGLVLGLSILGTLLVSWLIYWGLAPLTHWLRQWIKPLDKLFDWWFSHTRDQHAAQFRRYGNWAVLLVAATPLPLAGGWTGALLAYLFNLQWQWALPILAAGALIFGIIVTLVTVGGIKVFSL